MNEKILAYVKQNHEETIRLLKELAAIPAPSGKEEKRAVFIYKWYLKQGIPAQMLRIDEAKNVIFEWNPAGADEFIVFAAHTDVIFPDEEPFAVTEKNGRLYAPGIGDDTANLVNLLMSAKFVTEHENEWQTNQLPYGILFVANSCEEGLGNLYGTKVLFKEYEGRIKEFVSFDVYLDTLVETAVGSCRYQVKVQTVGGHSYIDFDDSIKNKSAISVLCDLITEIGAIPIPAKAKTTYNIGKIEGGVSVNTIAEEASMLVEFRSEDAECLEYMNREFDSILKRHRSQAAPKIGIGKKLLGIRPCNKGVEKAALHEMTMRHKKILETYTGTKVEPAPCSTDANIPLSLGIPANTIGTVAGADLHTRGEWIEIASMIPGQCVAVESVTYYLSAFLV